MLCMSGADNKFVTDHESAFGGSNRGLEIRDTTVLRRLTFGSFISMRNVTWDTNGYTIANRHNSCGYHFCRTV